MTDFNHFHELDDFIFSTRAHQGDVYEMVA